MARFTGLTRGLSSEGSSKFGVGQLPGSVVTASSSPAQTPGLPWAINARDSAYGAKGNNVADDTASIAGALSTGRDVFLPNGTYLVDGLNYQAGHQRIWAESRQGVILKAKTGAASGYAVRISGQQYCALEGLTIDGGGTTNADGLRINSGAATSQSQSLRRLFIQNAAKGIYIENVGSTQADKNTFYDTVLLGNAIGFQSDSVNSQETIFVGVNVGFTANNQVGFKLNASGGGACLGILGGQCQGNGVATGLTGILISTGSNLGWVWLDDYIDEQVQTSIDGTTGFPVSGVHLKHCTLQGSTANVNIGPVNGGSVGGALYARLCQFNGSTGSLVGGGVIKSFATGGGPKVVLEDCNLSSASPPSFTTNGGAVASIFPGEVPRRVGAAGQPTFGADFANVAGDSPLRFSMNRSGDVIIAGSVKSPAGQAASTTIFTLPVGYRPATVARGIATDINAGAGSVNNCYALSSGAMQWSSAFVAGNGVALNIRLTPGL